MAEDLHGRQLWDAVAGTLAAQASDQAALTSRAKDFLSMATISTTITGVILNDKLFSVSEIELSVGWIALASVSLLLVYGAGIWALVPRQWSFAPDAADFYAVEQESPFASEGELYRAMAEGYLLAGDGQSQLERNAESVKFIEMLVRIQSVGVIGLGAAAFILAFLVERAPR